MSASLELSQAQDEVYREMGRSVLMLQHIERLLKALLNIGRFTGTLTELRDLYQRGYPKSDKRTLGQLIGPIIEHHLTPVEFEDNLPANPEVPLFSISVSFPHSETERDRLQKRLEEVVARRNGLIHHSLDWVKLDSVESCRVSSKRLNGEREQMRPVYNQLKFMTKTMVEMHAEGAEKLEAEIRAVLATKMERNEKSAPAE